MPPEFLSNSFDFDNEDIVAFLDELPLWSAPFGIELLNRVKYKKNMSVIDIGCGLGFPLTELAMRLGNTSTVYGLDPWTAALKHLEKKLKIYNINNVELINGIAEEIKLKDNSIDLIVSNNGLNNVKDLNKSFSECKRIAKPGCQFVATMNLDGTMEEFYSVFKDVVIAMGLPGIVKQIDKHIYEKRRPVKEILALFNENNFKTSHELFSFRYKFADGTSMLNYFLIRIAFYESWIKLIPSDKIVEVFSEIELRLNKIAEDQTGIVLSIPFLVVDAERTN